MTDGERPKCPECGGETTFGYGLAGGGIGAYAMCLDCDWFEKEQDEEDLHFEAHEIPAGSEVVAADGSVVRTTASGKFASASFTAEPPDDRHDEED